MVFYRNRMAFNSPVWLGETVPDFTVLDKVSRL